MGLRKYASEKGLSDKPHVLCVVAVSECCAYSPEGLAHSMAFGCYSGEASNQAQILLIMVSSSMRNPGDPSSNSNFGVPTNKQKLSTILAAR